MNWLDYAFIGVFIVSFAVGVVRGLSRGVVGLIAAVAGILFACRWYSEAGMFIHDYVSSRAVANAMGFVLIVVLFLILGGLLGLALAKAFKWVGIGWLDRLLGGAFGLVRAALISIAIVMIAMAFPRNILPDAVIHSRFAPYFVEAAGTLVAVTPPELKDAFWKNYEEVKRLWADMVGYGKKKLPEAQI